ncbi:MAG: Outer membrane protein domain-containing protein [Rhodospirillaceae bacterium]|nr:MAG: Outer membrane protein domain-containing protein [Rhodospirillaceae bacterium]
MLGGKTIVVTTGASNFGNAKESDTLTVTVNGVTFYQGAGTSLTAQNALDLLALLGMADGWTVAQQQITRSQTHLSTGVIATRIASLVSASLVPRGSRGKDSSRKPQAGMASGFAAGDPTSEIGLGVWATPANSWIADSTSFAKYRGTIQNLILGGDYKITPTIVAGLAVGLEHTFINTSFNAGDMEGYGISGTPYLGGGGGGGGGGGASPARTQTEARGGTRSQAPIKAIAMYWAATSMATSRWPITGPSIRMSVSWWHGTIVILIVNPTEQNS